MGRGLLLLASVAVLGWCTVVAERRIYPRFADSDTVWLLSLAHDLFDRHGALWGWNLSPHPNFFPEFLAVELVRRLSTTLQGFFLGYGLTNVLSVFLVSWLGLWLYLRAGSVGSASQRGVRVSAGDLAMLGAFVVTSSWLLAFNLGLFTRPLRYGFLPAYHFPPMVMALLIGFLAIEQFDRPPSRRRAVAVVTATALMIASGLSDKITALNVLPGLTTAALYHTIRAGPASGTALATVPVLAAGGAALLWADAFWNSFAQVTEYPIPVDLAKFPQQAVGLWQAIVTPWPPVSRKSWLWPAQATLTAIIAVAATALAVQAVWRALRSRASSRQEMASAGRTKAESLEVFLLATPLLVTLVVLLLGRLPDHRYLRMVIPLFHFVPLAIVARALGYLAPRFTGRGFFASFAAGLVVVGIVSTRHGPARARFSERTPLLACLEGNAGEYDLRHGLGFHWQAHLPSVLSGHRFVIRSIGTKGTIPRWHNSFAWYGAAAGEEPFTYIVVTPSFDGLAIEETFGPPTHRLMCPHTTAAVPEYAAWAPTSLEPSRLWIYEGAEKERLNRAIREQYERGKREIFAGLRREAEEVQ